MGKVKTKPGDVDEILFFPMDFYLIAKCSMP
jgi:hypothetical protein